MNREPTTMVELFGGSEVSAIENPYPVFERLRHEDPVVPIRTLAGHITHLLTRYDDVFTALQDDSVFSNKSNARGISLVMGRTIVEMDGDEHLHHRKLIRPNFAPRVVRAEEFKSVIVHHDHASFGILHDHAFANAVQNCVEHVLDHGDDAAQQVPHARQAGGQCLGHGQGGAAHR